MVGIEPYPRRDSGDFAAALMRAGLGSIPVVGATASELFAFVLGAPLERRRERWFESLVEALQERVAANQLSLESLPDNNLFVDSVSHATAAAMRTHQQDKLDALRNAVLNTASSSVIDVDEASVFITMIDGFTPWHIRILSFMDDPVAAGAFNAKEFYTQQQSTMFRALCRVHPGLAQRDPFATQVVRDLFARGLIERQDIHAPYMPGGAIKPNTTGWGKQFLAFIRRNDRE